MNSSSNNNTSVVLPSMAGKKSIFRFIKKI